MKVLTTIFFIILTLLCLTRTTLSLNKRQNLSPINWFILTKFECSSDKTKCDKVKNVINLAGKYITATLNLKFSIKIDAKFKEICKGPEKCDAGHKLLGAASPAMIPEKDTDNKTRLFPQALYKQIRSKSVSGDDIKLILNSEIPYWFRGDPKIQQDQIDLLCVVIHELIHGLGFTNSWDDYLPKTFLNQEALIPDVSGFDDPKKKESPSETLFVENIFDKFIVLIPSGKTLSSITDELNQFQFNAKESSEQDFFNSFSKSPQFLIAQDVYKNATEYGKMGFLLTSNIQPGTQLTPDHNDIILLETYINPFNNGSNIGHVDKYKYHNTSDFLMVHEYSPGKTLDEMMENSNSTNITGPIGPKLRRLLGVLGYDVKNDYTPPDINTGIHNSFNLLLSFVCILLNIINFI